VKTQQIIKSALNGQS